MHQQKVFTKRSYQLTITSLRKKFTIKLREEQLQKIFRTLRNSIVKINYEPSYPKAPLPIQYPLFMPSLQPQNIQAIQYLMRFIPPNIPTAQPMITGQNTTLIQVNNHRPNSPPIPYEIYFQKQNFRVYKKLIGQGSFSKVWLGVDLLKNQQIAAKEVKKLEESEERCLKQFNSPNIIKVLKIIRHQKSTFIILEFCSKNLREELIDCNYDLEKSLSYFEQIVRGINQLQQNNIIHRDLKFQNILLSENVIKIADFGLAKFLGDEMEIQSRRCGSPYTMAPEIYFSDSRYPSYTSKCDIWSLGVLLHQMLYKQHPFSKSKQHFKKGLRIRLKRKFGVLDQLIDRCLVENPRKRADWKQFVQLFEKYFVNRGRYLAIDLFPIECESIIFEENASKQLSVVVEHLVRNEKTEKYLMNQQPKNRKEKECLQKMKHDLNMIHPAEKKVQVAQRVNLPKLKLNEDKAKTHKQEKKNQQKAQIKERFNDLLLRPKQKKTIPRLPFYRRDDFDAENKGQKKLSQIKKVDQEKQQIQYIKQPKLNQESQVSRIVMEFGILGLVTILIVLSIFMQ